MAEGDTGSCPDWVDEVVDAVGDCMVTDMAPMAFDVWGPDDPEAESLDDPWLVHFYPSLTEMVGGPKDGAVVFPGFTLDIQSLQECLDDIDELSLSSKAMNREQRYDGTVLDLLGWYQEHPIWVRIFDVPPDDATIDSMMEHRSGRLRRKNQPPR
jgi:hypothetical protein